MKKFKWQNNKFIKEFIQISKKNTKYNREIANL